MLRLNLFIHQTIKIFELIFIFSITVNLVYKFFAFGGYYQEDILSIASACLVVAYFHLFSNNLLTNLRLKLAVAYPWLTWPCWKLPNLLALKAERVEQLDVVRGNNPV